MKTKRGFTIIELLVVIGILSVCSVALLFSSKHVVGNKQIIDFNHQHFNVAYIRTDDNKWERINVKAWKDWNKSDSIQIIKTDGNAIYTHLYNVKLCKE